MSTDVWIYSSPSFSWGRPVQILVRPDVVVKETELEERRVPGVQGIDRKAAELLFGGAEESLGPAVLPGAMLVDALVADAEQKESKTKQKLDLFGSAVNPGSARVP